MIETAPVAPAREGVTPSCTLRDDEVANSTAKAAAPPIPTSSETSARRSFVRAALTSSRAQVRDGAHVSSSARLSCWPIRGEASEPDRGHGAGDDERRHAPRMRRRLGGERHHDRAQALAFAHHQMLRGGAMPRRREDQIVRAGIDGDGVTVEAARDLAAVEGDARVREIVARRVPRAEHHRGEPRVELGQPGLAGLADERRAARGGARHEGGAGGGERARVAEALAVVGGGHARVGRVVRARGGRDAEGDQRKQASLKCL